MLEQLDKEAYVLEQLGKEAYVLEQLGKEAYVYSCNSLILSNHQSSAKVCVAPSPCAMLLYPFMLLLQEPPHRQPQCRLRHSLRHKCSRHMTPTDRYGTPPAHLAPCLILAYLPMRHATVGGVR